MARHGGVRSNSGRKAHPDRFTQYDQLTNSKNYLVTILGKYEINQGTSATAKKQLFDAVVPALKELGFTIAYQEIRDDDTFSRRKWSSAYVSSEHVLGVVEEFSGANLEELAYETYNTTRDLWSTEEAKNASGKMRQMLRKLLAAGKIVERYRASGERVYFPTTHPDADKFSLVPTARIRGPFMLNLDGQRIMQGIPPGPNRPLFEQILLENELFREPYMPSIDGIRREDAEIGEIPLPVLDWTTPSKGARVAPRVPSPGAELYRTVSPMIRDLVDQRNKDEADRKLTPDIRKLK